MRNSSYFMIPTMYDVHLSIYNSRIPFPSAFQKKKKGGKSDSQIRAVALGLRTIPAKSPSDHMGVSDPLCVTRQ